MFKPKLLNKLEAMRFEQKLQWAFIGGLIIICLLLIIVVISISSNKVHRISIPPELRFGAVVETGTISKFEVWSFAGYITQQMYLWRSNGVIDFDNNIKRLSAFGTPEYRDYLLKQYTNLNGLGELAHRERSLQLIEAYADKNTIWRGNYWLVGIDYRLQEHISNKRFKDFNVRFFIKVVTRNIDPENNPWGLQIDAPDTEPTRLKDNLIK